MKSRLVAVGRLRRTPRGTAARRFGVAVDNLRPVDGVGAQTAPVLIIGGEADPYTPVWETRELYERARNSKELWIVPGAGHVNIHRHARAEYERRVGTFHDRNLHREHRRIAPPCPLASGAPGRDTWRRVRPPGYSGQR